MAISDSSPERRNFVLTSIAFILFYAGEGYFVDGNVRILLINMSFAKPYAISFFAWIMLFWFCLRFYHKFGFNFFSSLRMEIFDLELPEKIKQYAIMQSRKQLIGTNKSDFSSCDIEIGRVNIDKLKCQVVCNFSKQGTRYHQEVVEIRGINGSLTYMILVTKAILSRNAFSEELLPYLLFLIAVGLAGYDYLCSVSAG